MAPEEFRWGATIDERTTEFTVGRMAQVLLGDGDEWRADPALAGVVDRATSDVPADRFPTFTAFARTWRGGYAERVILP